MIAAMLLVMVAADPDLALDREAVLTFARCVDRRAPDRTAALLASEPGSDDEFERMKVIAGAYNTCLAGKRALSFPTPMLRGQMAELAFQNNASMREKAARLPAGGEAIPDSDQIEKAVARVPAARRDQAYATHFRTAYARCVAVAAPAAVARMISTASASEEERKALVDARDTLMHCMPQGIAYHLKPAELRPYLMSELYFLAVAGARAGG